MNPLVEREGFRIESTVPQKKKKVKSKGVEHIQIIDDDAPIPWNSVPATTTSTKTKTKTKTNQLESMINDEILSVEDAPVIVGIIDERPKEVREKERFKDVKRWRAAAFEEIPEPGSIGPQPKPSKSSRQKQNESDDSDPDLDRGRTVKHEDLDLSPPRKRRTQPEDDDPSPPRRRPQTADDSSPPRRKRDDQSSSGRRRQADDDPSPPRKKRGDSSPPRRRRQSNDDRSSPRRKHKHKHDSSPPRRYEKSSSPPSRRRHTKDADSSPPRRRDRSPSPPVQPAKSQRRRLVEKKEEISERYAQWGRGLAQVRQAEETVKDYIELAEKPLARYRDDQDLDSMLKQKEREDDPMLKYLTKKSSDTAGGRTDNPNQPPPKPRYKGPEPQKNRFNIWPGYRWDGVDRSNGYEKKLFESIANRHAKAQEAYLWSVEDM